MESLYQLDWKTIFVPTMSVAEIFLRGTVIYLLLFGILRVLRREAGAISVGDLLVVVLVADAAQNAMAGDYKSITEGVLLVGTIDLSRQQSALGNLGRARACVRADYFAGLFGGHQHPRRPEERSLGDQSA